MLLSPNLYINAFSMGKGRTIHSPVLTWNHDWMDSRAVSEPTLTKKDEKQAWHSKLETIVGVGFALLSGIVLMERA